MIKDRTRKNKIENRINVIILNVFARLPLALHKDIVF